MRYQHQTHAGVTRSAMRHGIAMLLTAVFLTAMGPSLHAADDPTEVLNKFGEAMVKVAEKVKPAVVNISTSKTVKSQRHPFLDDPFFRRFFGNGGQQKRKVTNLGSGVIATAVNQAHRTACQQNQRVTESCLSSHSCQPPRNQ